MPIFQTIAFSGTFFAITRIPGFPTDRSVNWYLPLAACMGSGFSGIALGFSTVRLLTNNPAKVARLQSCGITVTERVPLKTAENRHNQAYLATKAAPAAASTPSTAT